MNRGSFTAAVLLVILLGTGGCQSTQSGLSANYEAPLKKYQTRFHFKAFAATSAAPGSGWAYGYSTAKQTAVEAVEEALKRCVDGVASVSIGKKCRVTFLGNRPIDATSELDQLTSQYQANPASFN